MHRADAKLVGKLAAADACLCAELTKHVVHRHPPYQIGKLDASPFFTIMERDHYLDGSYALWMVPKIGRKAPPKLYLSEWRDFRGLNQEQLAGRMGVTAATVSRKENDKRGANTDYLARLAVALDCRPEDFWRDPAKPDPAELLRSLPAEAQAHVLRIIQTFKTGT